MKPSPLPRLLTEREAASRLRIHIATLQRIRRRGEIRFRRVGRQVRYLEDWITEYLEAAPWPVRNDPDNSAITGSRAGRDRTNGIAPGTRKPLPAIDAQNAKALALRTLRKPN
ncbi:MAG: helix-turn-helix domain-containing protein [Parvularculaceae bacterium]